MDTKNNKTQVRPEEVYLEGKYNPALFLPANAALDPFCQDMIQRGLETAETRKYIQRDLLDSKNSRCTDLFCDRNKKASECKFAQVETCSYCEKKCDSSKLYVYFLLASLTDPVMEDLRKKSILKAVMGWNLETKIRDVRSIDPVVINGGCALLCLSRCDGCMTTPKIEVVD